MALASRGWPRAFPALRVYAAYIAKNDENRRRQQSDPRYQPSYQAGAAMSEQG